MRIGFLFLFKKKGWGGSRERITYLNLKVVVFVFRGKDHEDSQADDVIMMMMIIIITTFQTLESVACALQPVRKKYFS